MKPLTQAVQSYLAMRRDLGFKLRDAGMVLAKFAAFMEQRNADVITTRLALEWAQQPSKAQPALWAQRLSYVRCFARHRIASDPKTEIPAPGLLPFRPQRANPYLYSDEDIQRLLEAALTLSPGMELRRWTFHVLLGLLSVTGLRVGEALRLKLDDVDLDNGVLTVRGTKFGKSRLVPIHTSTRQVMTDYRTRRSHLLGQRDAAHFFVTQTGHQLDGGDVRRVFYRLSRQIGLRVSIPAQRDRRFRERDR
jgi:integrase/recombinase XerD